VPARRKSSGASGRIGRRDVLHSLATGLASAVTLPAVPERAREQEAIPPEDSQPLLLDDYGRRTLGALAERLVPGSGAAGVVDLLDRLMAVESTEAQRWFLNAIGAFEREARERYSRAFLEIAGSQQEEILAAASTMAPATPAPPAWTKGQPVERRPEGPPPPANLRDHFDRLRGLVARAYYATEPGMKELGFTGRMAWPTLPGCTHPGDEHR
jgi:Gluconate 2-dehydrogenase subunit 3